MILHPATVLFRRTRASEKALAVLMAGNSLAQEDAGDKCGFEEIVGMAGWARAEEEFGKD